MLVHINIDEEIARELFEEELRKAPKSVKDAKTFEEYCKKNIQRSEKESMKFGFFTTIAKFFKKSKPSPLIHPLHDISVSPLQASIETVESEVRPSSDTNTLETPLLDSNTQSSQC